MLVLDLPVASPRLLLQVWGTLTSCGFAEASALRGRHSGIAESLRECLLWRCCGSGAPSPFLAARAGKELWEAKGFKISALNVENGSLHDFACQRFVY